MSGGDLSAFEQFFDATGQVEQGLQNAVFLNRCGQLFERGVVEDASGLFRIRFYLLDRELCDALIVRRWSLRRRSRFRNFLDECADSLT